jgi:hypothetical protein
MPKPEMPQLGGVDVQRLMEWSRAGAERVQIAVAVTSEDHRPRLQILNGETECVKFDSNRILASKSTNRN